MSISNNIPDFLKSEGYIRFDPERQTTSKALYEVYRDWCVDNVCNVMRPNTFWSYLNQNLETYHLTPTRSIPIGNNKYARGYQGISLCSRF